MGRMSCFSIYYTVLIHVCKSYGGKEQDDCKWKVCGRKSFDKVLSNREKYKEIHT